jgi:hypothetical protein
MAYAFAQTEDSAAGTATARRPTAAFVGFRTKMVAVLGSGQLAGAVDAASGHDTFAEIDANDLANVMAKLPKYAEVGRQVVLLAAGLGAGVPAPCRGAGGVTMSN